MAKRKFSPFELEIRDGVNVDYPEIKKVGVTSDAGNHQAKHGYFIGRSRYESSTHI